MLTSILAQLRNALCSQEHETIAAKPSVETRHHQHAPVECRTYRGLAGTDGNNAVLPPSPLGVPAIYEPSALQVVDAEARNTHAKGF